MHHLIRRVFGPLQGCLSVVTLYALPRNFLVTPTDVEMLPDVYTLLVIEFSNLPVVRHQCSLRLDHVQTWVKSPRPRAVLNIYANQTSGEKHIALLETTTYVCTVLTAQPEWTTVGSRVAR